MMPASTCRNFEPAVLEGVKRLNALAKSFEGAFSRWDRLRVIPRFRQSAISCVQIVQVDMCFFQNSASAGSSRPSAKSRAVSVLICIQDLASCTKSGWLKRRKYVEGKNF